MSCEVPAISYMEKLPKEKKKTNLLAWYGLVPEGVQEGNFRGSCFVPLFLLDDVPGCVTNPDIWSLCGGK